MTTMPSIVLSVFSFGISFLTVNLIRQRFRQSLLDIPNERSSHTQPTPRGGGLGFIIAFAITSAIAMGNNYVHLFADVPLNLNLAIVWLILIPLAIVGIIDDRSNVPAGIRYLVQLAAAGVAVTYFGAFPQPWLSQFGVVGSIVAIVLTTIGMTAIVNFYNFMDGLDGIVAGTSAIQLGFFAFYLHQPLLWFLVAALVGFLWWNWSPAKVFMGDAGSTVLGATVAIALLNAGDSALQAWSALAVTLPLVGDAVYTIVRRLLQKENIFQAHRSHLYQRLQQSGWAHERVAATYMGITLAIALVVGFYGLKGAIGGAIGTVAAGLGGEIYLRSRLIKQGS
ncbi:glycosyltransferase family 4 protein [Chroococcidiopsis sp. FACHB-1243]|nr:glycosyltransferase family 4 protein [Chroococcidiopsis sp. [FACHB-1243]]MBD2308793.1 glycosyltransferase family 4 protein [Chroococcidiopsis sp. [FACHB-1243]]